MNPRNSDFIVFDFNFAANSGEFNFGSITAMLTVLFIGELRLVPPSSPMNYLKMGWDYCYFEEFNFAGL